MAEAGKHNPQALKTGVVMDPISGIKSYKDSTFAMLLEAQRRGHSLYYMEPGDLYAKDGRVFARMQQLEVRDNRTDWYSLAPTDCASLDELDIVLMRRDPPFDMDYIYATYMLELAENAGTLIINRPQSLRDANEKFFINEIPETSKVSSSVSDVRAASEYNATLNRSFDFIPILKYLAPVVGVVANVDLAVVCNGALASIYIKSHWSSVLDTTNLNPHPD